MVKLQFILIITLSFFSSCKQDYENITSESLKIRWDNNSEIQNYLKLNTTYINFLLSNFRGNESESNVVELMLIGQEIASNNTPLKTDKERLALKYYELTVARSNQGKKAINSDNLINSNKEFYLNYIAEHSPTPVHKLK